MHSHNKIIITIFAEQNTLHDSFMTDKIRIKDIAEKAGVSMGTVDRVLHKRPNVSKVVKAKVEKAIKEMGYKPNMYASALAYNKTYSFVFLIPSHEQEAYWEEIELGATRCEELRRDFHIQVSFLYYIRNSDPSFLAQASQVMKQKPNGVVVVPIDLETTRRFTDKLHEAQIPFILLDSYMPDLKPLSFYGQDSFQSGYFAARMLMLIARGEKKIMLMKHTRGGKVGSKQQANREVGFRHYMTDHFPEVDIVEVDLPADTDRKEYPAILDNFFNQNAEVHNCITFTSKAHLVGDYLLKTNRRDVQIMGYDVVGKNANCLREGSISFLIAQHAYRQGYYCVETLFRAIVMKEKVDAVNYMPIELLAKENIDFYRRTQL